MQDLEAGLLITGWAAGTLYTVDLGYASLDRDLWVIGVMERILTGLSTLTDYFFFVAAAFLEFFIIFGVVAKG